MLFEYSKEYQEKVAQQVAELKADGDYNESIGMVNDYGKTRDSIRSCLDHLVKK